jgi:hypothetical protein
MEASHPNPEWKQGVKGQYRKLPRLVSAGHAHPRFGFAPFFVQGSTTLIGPLESVPLPPYARLAAGFMAKLKLCSAEWRYIFPSHQLRLFRTFSRSSAVV